MLARCLLPDAERLRRVNALLKVALALPKHARAGWVAALAGEQRELAAALAALLARESDPFMRRPVTGAIFRRR
jgi:hypothetical protein